MTYSINGISGTELTQIQNAINAINLGPVGQTTGVAFVPATQGQTPKWTIQNGATPAHPNAGAESTAVHSGTTLTSMTTIIGINNVLGGTGQPIYSPTQLGYATVFYKVTLHEAMHGFGLADVTANEVPGQTVMNQIHSANDSGGSLASQLTNCDYNAVDAQPFYLTGGGDGGLCPEGNCELCGPAGHCDSPILIDTDGHGFHLTSAEDGVLFDLRSESTPQPLAWTSPGSTNAFLVLDRNGNGVIDDGTELFGNYSPQPPSSDPNGFLALAEFDKPEHGGNGNGFIDTGDLVFSLLRLWIDVNHDGFSQAEELHNLPELGVLRLSLDYLPSRRVDEYGNRFGYKARIADDSRHFGRWAYDVFLTVSP